MGFALWLHLHMCNQTFLFFCQYSLRLPWRSPMVSSLSGWNTSCVSLLWGIFLDIWVFQSTSGSGQKYGDVRTSGAILKRWGMLLLEKYPTSWTTSGKFWDVLYTVSQKFSVGLSLSFPQQWPIPNVSFNDSPSFPVSLPGFLTGSSSQNTTRTQNFDAGSNFERIQTKSIKFINLTFSCSVTSSNLLVLPSLIVSICSFIK